MRPWNANRTFSISLRNLHIHRSVHKGIPARHLAEKFGISISRVRAIADHVERLSGWIEREEERARIHSEFEADREAEAKSLADTWDRLRMQPKTEAEQHLAMLGIFPYPQEGA